MTRSRSPAQSEKTPSAFVVLSPTLSEVAVDKSFTLRELWSYQWQAGEFLSQQEGKRAITRVGHSKSRFGFWEQKKIEFKIVFLYVVIHLFIRENTTREENTMSFVLTLIWISVSHSSVIEAQSESGSFDVIWKVLFYFATYIFCDYPIPWSLHSKSKSIVPWKSQSWKVFGL